LSLSVA